MLDAVTLDQMRVFVAIAEAGSFRAGAGRLSRTQSAISHAIGNLEDHLGVALFDRSNHRPTLTPEGRALLADARAILLKIDSMGARPRGLGEGIELGLAIALDPQFPLGLAAAALKDLHAAYPSVSVQLCTAPLGLQSSRFAKVNAHWRSPQPRSRTHELSWRRSFCAARRDRRCGTLSCCVLQEWGAAYTAELADHV
jgi:DNA-binding MarR family transcriptional regulator